MNRNRSPELPYTVQDTENTTSGDANASHDQASNAYSDTLPPSYDSVNDDQARGFAIDIPPELPRPQTPPPSYSPRDHGRRESSRTARPSSISQCLNMTFNIQTSPSNPLAGISRTRPRFSRRQPIDPCNAMIWMIVVIVVMSAVIGVLVWVLH